jgi:16S rRNA processing protein RimM
LVSRKLPENLVVMGRVSAPFGVKGWIKVQPFTSTIDSLAAYKRWWLGSNGNWQEHAVERAQAQGRTLVAKLEACDDRNLAVMHRGKQVAVPREALPQVAANEFYWADLVGLRVISDDSLDFGEVIRILETGANEVLVVQGDGGQERLIPFIANVVRKVDLAAGVIRVDWGLDY